MKTRLGVVPVLLFLLLSMSACDDKMEDISKYMLLVSKANLELSNDVKIWFDQGLISKGTGDGIMAVVERISVAGTQVDDILRKLDKLDLASADAAVKILGALHDELDIEKLTFIAGITNPQTKQNVMAAFVGIRATVGSVMIILASVGG